MVDNQTFIEIIIFICIFLIINVFVLYPLILAIASKLFYRPIKKSDDYRPEISIVISAYNEEELIKNAILSIYKSDYPSELINVFVGSDGSTDRTIKIVNELSEIYPNIFCYEYERSGKNYVLNQLVPKTKTDIIFYMDADIRIEKNTISELIAYFDDENIGSVIASMLSIDEIGNDNSGRQGETSYQKYEKILRVYESNMSSTINSLGAFYGIRKQYYMPLPNEYVCDDLYPLYQVIINKKRVFFSENTIVKEVRKKSLNVEFFRRVRVAAGGLSTVWACKELLSPKYGWVSFFIWNHKVLRWFSPLYLIIIALGTIFLTPSSYLFYPLIILQGILYLGAIIGWILEKIKVNFLPFKILLFIVSMNIGFLFGIIRFFAREQNAKWEKM